MGRWIGEAGEGISRFARDVTREIGPRVGGVLFGPHIRRCRVQGDSTGFTLHVQG